MPRPRRKAGITDFSSSSRRLSAKARDDITLAIGLDPRNEKEQKAIGEIFKEIEKRLGIYFESTLANAQLPATADYKHELSSLMRVTSAYQKKLQNLITLKGH